MSVEAGSRALLAGGDVVLVRPLHPADTAEVLALHTRLTQQDTYFRFFGAPSRLDRLAAEIAADPGPGHYAVGCYRRGELLGVANYEVLDGSADAEVALVVDETVRTQGVATLLLEHLVSHARKTGLRRFLAEVLAENAKVLHVFKDLGLSFEASVGGPERDVVLNLDEDPAYLDAVLKRDSVADAASLAHLFKPSSIAVIGAGRRPGSVGHAVLANLTASGFRGPVEVVNPHARAILGVRSVPSVAELTRTPELAVICLPAPAAADAVEACGKRGVRAVVVISSGLTGTGFGERVHAAVREYGMRLVGPNCLGVVSTDPAHPYDLTFLATPVRPGNIGVVTQSGGVGIALAESLGDLGLGVSTLVSTGDKYDVSGNDLLMWWTADLRTELVVLYLESFGNPRKFGRLARQLARTRPVLAVRSGSGDTAQRAAASHTAAAATPAVTRDALFEQAGVIAVDTVAELVDVIAGLSWQLLPGGPRVAVVSNAGGAGVLAADACEREGLVMAELSEHTRERLVKLLPAEAAARNPVDTTAAVAPAVFADALRAVLDDDGVDAVIAATVPTAVGDPGSSLAAVLPPEYKTVFAVRPGQRARVEPLVPGRGVTACYDDPAAAAAVLARLVRYEQWLNRPETEDSLAPLENPEALRSFAAEREGWLSPADAVELLRLAEVPMVETHYVEAGDSMAAAAADLGAPVVLKADADGVLHKTAAGGVLLNVHGADRILEAFRTLRSRFGSALRGVTVQPMAEPGRELLVGVRSDPVFGPLVVFGLGGVDTDLIDDRAARLAPLTGADADLLLDGLRSSKALWAPGQLDRAAVRDLLLKVSRLAELVPELTELDLNPVRVRSDGCVALDVRARLERPTAPDPFLRGLRD
ncbi:acyl-CoA synthetase (NDP forming)/GNAT superfamily N-acetyltransferase [Amycolatopsis lexingtonensis]|uniref:Acyl-CoA synthetase (NDP forming)/GNAT superfamily N-acetyltransferase n=1 Tax=Amycolatopsis lexingtonensis TaxID=218822 RepID=A0ABR9HXM0_9PSEU|nr:bifunctional GNAT family N-acetyltransferase/acetate--CoA ligase family protein [Amycolatopsis lexingtonensis]MBE1495692.1 acyl-CoA synthetase (NDP forming)/GNAT superfamily N-acetyltransferase [Amycolatopsis lexingtonensis]